MRILFFAQLKDATGRSEVQWPDVGALNSEQLWERLVRQFPRLEGHRPCVRLARNGTYAKPDEPFEPGDEVALIPPVSGG
jgi:molybdopterin converting factor subunit 1